MRAVLVYSGGLDSTTLLYEYKDSIALAVSFDYGSKHNKRELEFAALNCKRLGIRDDTVIHAYCQSCRLSWGDASLPLESVFAPRT